MIRVLLVDDSPLVLHVLQRMLSRFSEIKVVGTAADGREALELVPTLNPDVICTDLHMLVMDGLEFTCAVMDKYPRPILVVSVSVEPGSPNVFRLLEAGAVDILPKPRDIMNGDMDRLANELASKIRILAGVKVFRRHNTYGVVTTKHLPERTVIPNLPAMSLGTRTPFRIVVIGASTGGPQAFRNILGQLPANFPLPVVCVQHIGSSFLSELVAWLAEVTPLPVRKAKSGEIPHAGVVYFAPEDTHLELDDGGHFVLSATESIDGHRPSVTATMCSVARCFGAATVGVLLTGMGRDGADGMASITASGGVTIAQDEASSTVYGMPKQAVELGVVKYVLPLEQIAPMLCGLVSQK
jgi:two-component system chemotaxis response regulator CheB